MKSKNELASEYLKISNSQKAIDEAAFSLLQKKHNLHNSIIGYMLQHNAKAFDLGNGMALKLTEDKTSPPLGCKEDPLFETLRQVLIEWPISKLPTNYKEALI